jgi:5-(carboxyamino)imidazole ribonucleotide synthase
MFCLPDGAVLINEVAPRPHNSGHYTIEACVTSQFEQHIRAITGIPLGSTKLLTPVVMSNILGAEGESGRAAVKGAKEALENNGLTLHVYGKEFTKPKRKMGHLTVVGDDLSECIKTADKAAATVSVVAEV